MFAKAFMRTILCALLLQACSPAPISATTHEPTTSAEPTLVASVEASPAPTSTATSPPTVEPTVTVVATATVWPPTFVPWSLQDIRELASFVVTINEKNTVNGKLTELTNTVGYIKEPYSAYDQNQYASGTDRTYVVDGWTYSLTGSGDWYISAGSHDDLFLKGISLREIQKN
jgi:hypothetical protein